VLLRTLVGPGRRVPPRRRRRGFPVERGPGYRDYAPGDYAAYLLDPDGNNVEARYRDEGNIGHGIGPSLT
jgi:hypothetical protein